MVVELAENEDPDRTSVIHSLTHHHLSLFRDLLAKVTIIWASPPILAVAKRLAVNKVTLLLHQRIVRT